jgi:uncharacterized membrane protein YjjB (DUF3815 family)
VAILIQRFIFYFSIVPLVVACLIGVVRYQRLDKTRRYLVWLSLLALLVSIVSMWLAYHKRPNLFLAPLDTAIEFTLLALMYRRTLRPVAVVRYLPAAIGLFLLGTALSYQPLLNTIEFSPIQHVTESVMVLVLVLLYFRHKLKLPMSLAPLEHEPMFWISAGLLLYFSGSIFIFLSSNAVLNLSQELSRNVWAIHALLYSFLNGFYVVALSVDPRPEPGVTQS